MTMAWYRVNARRAEYGTPLLCFKLTSAITATRSTA
jgi:hypothetical protein